jgi:amino acid transporter
MKTVILIVVNLALVAFFVYLLRKPGSLTFFSSGRVWLTWLSVAVITLMDELTSVFYAPAEAFRFIGPSAIVFIAFTSLFVHYMTTRLVEIGEILEHHKIFGGGVYSFSYLVLGPTISFVAVSSITVDYVLTACISSVSAVENATSFFPLSSHAKMIISIAIIWAVGGLNILGIRDNAWFTFVIFILAALFFLSLIIGGVFALDEAGVGRIRDSFHHASAKLRDGSYTHCYGVFIASVASCVLAYSGVESVLQTAGLVKSWRDIAKSYVFLAATVGLITPLVAALALSAPIDFAKHEGDLITYYATMINGVPFGIGIAALASLTLIMAVNTAFVASSELLERVAERYGFHWLIVVNRNHSLYRIHILNSAFFSSIIIITQGKQMILADMYAIGLVASFCINMGSLIIYRYFMGTKEIIHFYTSRLMTCVIWLILLSCLIFLAWHKPHGTELWAIVTALVLAAGLVVSKTRAPEIKAIEQTDAQMDVIAWLAETTENSIHVLFRRPREESLAEAKQNEAYVTFYNPRRGVPQKMASNHFRIVLIKRTLNQEITALLNVMEFEFPESRIHVHFGWPLSSWVDRLSIGVMVFNIMRLPRTFERMNFSIEYPGRIYRPRK